MASFVAMIVSGFVAWGLHALIGDHVSLFTDFALGTLVGGVAYVAVYYWLRKLREGR